MSMTQNDLHPAVQNRLSIADVVAAARLLAGALAALPEDIPTPTHTVVYTFSNDGPEIEWLLFGDDSHYEAQKATAALVIRLMGGTWDKSPGALFSFETKRDGVRYGVTVNRDAVCKRVVTGEEPVELPAVEAQPARTETREIVEWVCEPLLAEAGA